MGLPNQETGPNFIRARTPQGVRRLYISKQRELGAFLQPLGAPQFVDGFWYAWYLQELKIDEMINSKIGDNNVNRER